MSSRTLQMADGRGAQVRLTFRAMGCGAEVIVAGPAELASRARARLGELERRWSRFLPDSEISRLNASGGRVMKVSADTFGLVDRAVDAWRLSGSLYDPTVLASLMAAGYDRSFERLPTAPGKAPADPPRPAPGCGGIHLDPVLRSVRLPVGVTLDPGGLGKGYAGDLVVSEVLDAGAAGALVNLGGDVRVAGDAPDGSWVVGVEDPFDPGREMGRIALIDGAVATSSRLHRRWTIGGEQRHHLIDPASGMPAGAGLAAVTVVAGRGWWAEALCKAAFVGGLARARRVLEDAGTPGLLVEDTGRRHGVAGFDRLAGAACFGR